MASRVAASLLAAAGLPHLAARSLDEYVALAAALGRAPARRLALRAVLRGAQWHAPLFDTRRWVRAWERALSALWDVHAARRAGAAAPHIVLARARGAAGAL
jgi:protein O-GlcNAc transferase